MQAQYLGGIKMAKALKRAEASPRNMEEFLEAAASKEVVSLNRQLKEIKKQLPIEEQAHFDKLVAEYTNVLDKLKEYNLFEEYNDITVLLANIEISLRESQGYKDVVAVLGEKAASRILQRSSARSKITSLVETGEFRRGKYTFDRDFEGEISFRGKLYKLAYSTDTGNIILNDTLEQKLTVIARDYLGDKSAHLIALAINKYIGANLLIKDEAVLRDELIIQAVIGQANAFRATKGGIAKASDGWSKVIARKEVLFPEEREKGLYYVAEAKKILGQ